jgi:hypothetical protein
MVYLFKTINCKKTIFKVERTNPSEFGQVIFWAKQKHEPYISQWLEVYV